MVQIKCLLGARLSLTSLFYLFMCCTTVLFAWKNLSKKNCWTYRRAIFICQVKTCQRKLVVHTDDRTIDKENLSKKNFSSVPILIRCAKITRAKSKLNENESHSICRLESPLRRTSCWHSKSKNVTMQLQFNAWLFLSIFTNDVGLNETRHHDNCILTVSTPCRQQSRKWVNIW